MTHARGDGKAGAAISIAALCKICPDLMDNYFGALPTEKPEIFQTSEGISQLLDTISQSKANIEEAARQLDHDRQISKRAISMVNIGKSSGGRWRDQNGGW